MFYAVSEGIKITFERDWGFWYHIVSNLSEYACTNNYSR